MQEMVEVSIESIDDLFRNTGAAQKMDRVQVPKQHVILPKVKYSYVDEVIEIVNIAILTGREYLEDDSISLDNGSILIFDAAAAYESIARDIEKEFGGTNPDELLSLDPMVGLFRMSVNALGRGAISAWVLQKHDPAKYMKNEDTINGMIYHLEHLVKLQRALLETGSDKRYREALEPQDKLIEAHLQTIQSTLDNIDRLVFMAQKAYINNSKEEFKEVAAKTRARKKKIGNRFVYVPEAVFYFLSDAESYTVRLAGEAAQISRSGETYTIDSVIAQTEEGLIDISATGPGAGRLFIMEDEIASRNNYKESNCYHPEISETWISNLSVHARLFHEWYLEAEREEGSEREARIANMLEDSLRSLMISGTRQLGVTNNDIARLHELQWLIRPILATEYSVMADTIGQFLHDTESFWEKDHTEKPN